MSERAFILGAGRVGTALARALRAAGVSVIGVHGRRAQAEPDAVSAGPLPASLGRASVVIVAVRDPQLEGVLSDLVAHMERLSQAAITPTPALSLSGGGGTDSRTPGKEESGT